MLAGDDDDDDGCGGDDDDNDGDNDDDTDNDGTVKLNEALLSHMMRGPPKTPFSDAHLRGDIFKSQAQIRSNFRQEYKDNSAKKKLEGREMQHTPWD